MSTYHVSDAVLLVNMTNITHYLRAHDLRGLHRTKEVIRIQYKCLKRKYKVVLDTCKEGLLTYSLKRNDHFSNI